GPGYAQRVRGLLPGPGSRFGLPMLCVVHGAQGAEYRYAEESAALPEGPTVSGNDPRAPAPPASGRGRDAFFRPALFVPGQGLFQIPPPGAGVGAGNYRKGPADLFRLPAPAVPRHGGADA